jgi:hypothetical protein
MCVLWLILAPPLSAHPGGGRDMEIPAITGPIGVSRDKSMEHVLKIFAENCRRVWEERNLILLHRPIFAAFGLVIGLLITGVVGVGEYAWFSSSLTSRDNEIRIKNATIENLQNKAASAPQEKNVPTPSAEVSSRKPCHGPNISNIKATGTNGVVLYMPGNIDCLTVDGFETKGTKGTDLYLGSGEGKSK